MHLGRYNQVGKVGVCKAFILGSSPSIVYKRKYGVTGKRDGLKIHWDFNLVRVRISLLPKENSYMSPDVVKP